MRVVSNDVIPASEARHRAVIRRLAMVVVIVAVCCPFSAAKLPANHDTIDGSTNTRARIIHTSFIYVCDTSSGEYCQVGTVDTWSIREAYRVVKTGSDQARNGSRCRQSSSSCSSESTESRLGDNENCPSNSYSLQATLSANLSLRIRVAFHNVSGGVYPLLQELNALLTECSYHVVVAIGDDVTVQTTAIVADALGIPVLGYVTQAGNPTVNIQGGTVTSLNPSPEAQGMVLAQIIGHYNMKQTAFIVQDTKVADGFLHGVREVMNDDLRDVFHVMCLNNTIRPKELLDKLIELSTTGWKLMVVHTDPGLMVRVVKSAVSTRLYNTGYAWFLSEAAHSRDKHVLSNLPEGLLAIESFWLGGIPDVMANALCHVITAFSLLLRDDVDTFISSAMFADVPYTNDARDANAMPNGMPEKVPAVTNWTWQDDYRHLFIRNLRKSIFCSRFISFEHRDIQCNDDLLLRYINASDSARQQVKEDTSNLTHGETPQASNDYHWERNTPKVENAESAKKDGPAFSLLNSLANGTTKVIWSRVGYITVKGYQNLRTVLWPGHNIYGPAPNSGKTYTVVTRPAEPFVFITHKVNKKEECFVDLPCLQVSNSSQHVLTKVVNDFQTKGSYVNDLYTIHCCKGLALDMLKTLSYDLNFNFVVYFVNDSDYGSVNQDGAWTGMVGDLVRGSADIIAGAFSITSQRMDAIHYTEPFYNNEYAQASGQDGNDVSIWAFTSPFSGQVWMCIFMSSIVAGIATSFLEWHSPFGLNPKGRKRTKNYGLGSGLLMVMVLVTGHTINIKAPKSWPGKLIQNVWAGLAIFIMTSYTANLAAYLAGQSAVTPATSIFDPELLTKKAAVIESSAVESFLNKINPNLAKRTRDNYIDSTVEAINLLRQGAIDVYFDDIALLEYGLARYDKDCKVHIAGKGFGTDGYAFGLAKHSWWLQIPMSNMISMYTEAGFVQDLARKYLSRPQCKNFVVGTATPYGLEHTGGLFLILVSSVFCSILLLFCEHLIYQFAVPWMRRKPPTSFWKTENLAFISQRVYRVVRSEHLYSQKQAAQEMIKIVKQRDFTRLIQKNELTKRKTHVQKKVKTKAEVFQEITANIISYHRQLQSASEDAETVASSDNADFLQGLTPDSIVLEPDDSVVDLIGVNNTGYSGDSFDFNADPAFMRQYSELEGESGETAFTFDNFGSLSKETDDFQHYADMEIARRLSSRSWAFPPRHLPETFALQRHSTSYIRRPLKRMSRKYSSSSGRALCLDEELGPGPSSPSRSSTVCDSHQPPPPPPPHQSTHVPLFHCVDSDNDMDTSLIDPVHSSSSLCLSSFSANSSSFFPSPLSSQLQSPTGNEDRISNQTTPSCRTTDTKLSELTCHHHPLAEDSPSHSHASPRLPELPLDPVVLDTTHKAPFSPLDGGHHLPNNNYSPFSVDLVPACAEEGGMSVSGVLQSDTASHRVYNDHGAEESVFDCEETSAGLPRRHNNGKTEEPLSNHDASDISKNMRKYSDLRDNHSQPTNLADNIGNRRKSYDKQTRDYFTRNIKLKDNRVKSTLRHHAMSGYQRTLPADFIDECTLEALSKEDLLVLWKKSEIDLESRLSEVLDRNRRLGLAIEYLSQADKPDGATQV